MKCVCGQGHKTNLSCKLYMSNMSIQNVIELLAKQGYRADVSEDHGSGKLRISTYEAVPQNVKDLVDASLPIGVTAIYSVNEAKSMPVPNALKKWATQIEKYIPKKGKYDV